MKDVYFNEMCPIENVLNRFDGRDTDTDAGLGWWCVLLNIQRCRSWYSHFKFWCTQPNHNIVYISYIWWVCVCVCVLIFVLRTYSMCWCFAATNNASSHCRCVCYYYYYWRSDVDPSNMCCYRSVSRLSVLASDFHSNAISLFCVSASECVRLQDMKYIHFFLFVSPFWFDRFLALSRYFVAVMTLVHEHRCVLVCVYVYILSFHIVRIDTFVLLCAFHMHLTAQQCTILFSRNWIFWLGTQTIEELPTVHYRKEHVYSHGYWCVCSHSILGARAFIYT